VVSSSSNSKAASRLDAGAVDGSDDDADAAAVPMLSQPQQQQSDVR
jgi:hypothetical protein